MIGFTRPRPTSISCVSWTLLLCALCLLTRHDVRAQSCQTPSEDATRVGHSGVEPPEYNESRFVADEAARMLDVPHETRATGAAVVVCLETTRVVGEVDDDGFLTKAQQHIDQGTLAETLLLTMRAAIGGRDVMGKLGFEGPRGALLEIEAFMHKGTAHEVSLGKLSGRYQSFDPRFPESALWQAFELEVDVRDVKFPADPCPTLTNRFCTAEPTPAENEITFEFTGTIWEVVPPTPFTIYMEVDWLTLEPKDEDGLAWRPVMLVHGLGGSIHGTSWSPNSAWADVLEARDIAFAAPDLTLDFMSINNTAEHNIGVAVEDLRKRIGVERVHIVGHCKGGTDAREYVENHDDVEVLFMLGAPNAGSFIEDYLIPTALLLNAYRKQDLTSFWMIPYNLFYAPNPKTRYVAAAGDNRDAWANFFAQAWGPNDDVVSVASALALPYAPGWTYQSSDSYSEHSSLLLNTEIAEDIFDTYMAVLTAPGDSQAAPDAAPRLAYGSGQPVSHALSTAAPVTSELHTVLIDARIARAGTTASHDVWLDPNAAAIFWMTGDPDSLQFALVRPDGTRIDTDATDPDVLHDYRDDGPLSYIGYQVENPAAGRWTLEVTGEGVYAVAVQVPYAAGQDGPALSASLDGDLYAAGDVVTITATVTDGGTPVTGAAVTADVGTPGAAAPTPLTLLDDGSGGDPTAGDGRYTGAFITTVAGSYSVSVSAERAAPAFERVAPLLVRVAESATAFSGTVADRGLDTNGDGLFEQLVLDLGLDVDRAASYLVFATLTDAAGAPLERVRWEQHLDAGVQIVSLAYDGAALYDLGLDGPYRIEDIVLQEVATGLGLDLAPAHTTGAYLHTDFQRPPLVLTGHTNDYGYHYDRDEAPPYEALIVEVEVDALFAASVRASAQLYSADGTYVSATKTGGSLSPGPNTLKFWFDATDIAQTARPGPFVVRHFAAWGSGTHAGTKRAAPGASVSLREPGVVAVTQPYALADFGGDPLPVELTVFTAVADAGDVVLSWETASETNNAGFHVEKQPAECEMLSEAACSSTPHWQALAFVEGMGTTTETQHYAYRVHDPAPGAYTFRLKQVDYDGTVTYSPEVEVTVEMPSAFMLEPAYPNPFNPQATIRFAVREAAPVHLMLYDAMGRVVETLFEGTPTASQLHEVRIKGSRLASGTYFVRLSGRGIQAVQQVVLTK